MNDQTTRLLVFCCTVALWAPSAIQADPTISLIDLEQDGDNGVVGLRGAHDVERSPDGQFILVASSIDSAVVVFARDPLSGQLTFIDSIHEFEADGLSLALAAAFSPTGANVYTTAFGEDKVGAFSFDSATGAVAFLEVEVNGVAGVENLSQPLDVVVSPDGDNVYVAALDSNSIVAFDRDLDGSLTFNESITDSTPGFDGLDAILGLTISPDGRHVYSAAAQDQALGVFSRRLDGGLDFLEVEREDVAGVDGLDQPQTVAVSPDGLWVVVSSHPDGAGNDDWISVFSRDPSSGLVEFESAFGNTAGPMQCGFGPTDPRTHLAFSDQSNRFFGSNAAAGGLGLFTIAVDGTVDLIRDLCDQADDLPFLQGMSGVEISTDGRHLYSSVFFTGTLLAFEVSGEIFADGFESGTVEAWSQSAP